MIADPFSFPADLLLEVMNERAPGSPFYDLAPLHILKARPPGAAPQLEPGRHALVEKLRVHALLPLGALVDQGLAQPHSCPQLQDVFRRGPALRLAALDEQLGHVIAVGTVGLGPPFRAAGPACLRWLGEMRGEAGALDLFGDEAPAGSSLEREVGIDRLEAGQHSASSL